MRLLLDEMLTPAIARELRARGHDVEAVAGHPDREALSDPEVMAVARAEHRADRRGVRGKARPASRRTGSRQRRGLAVAQDLPRAVVPAQEIIAELAGAPEMIRGYEQIKLDNVERYRQRTGELLDLLTASSAAGVRV